MTPSRRPTLEQLEDRCVPVTWGNPWPDATHLTLSFAPDGTAAGGLQSELSRTLDEAAPTASWQREVLRAFQAWAVHANINIGLVADGGQALAASGRPQGDARFGDVRLFGYDMSPEVLAISSPFEAAGGTGSGDVKVNTAYRFGVGGAGDVDLYTAILHEAAHVFGIDHSDDPNSAVFEEYLGRRTAGLTAEDVARLQALYGARDADRFEGSGGNGTLGTATRLNLLSNGNGALGFLADGDITTAGDVDVYRFQAPLNVASLNIRLHTEGISLLTARVTVYNSSGRVVGSAVAADPLDNELSVRVSSVLPLGTYYVKVEGNGNDVFRIGSYQLEVESVPLVGGLTGAVAAATDAALELLANNDLHLNDSFLTASLLSGVTGLTTQTTSRFEYAYRGSISDRWDVDYYRLAAPQAQAGVMTVMAWGTQNGGLAPRASVYDAGRNLVASEVVVNADGVFVIQVRNPVAGAAYYVKLEAADPRGANGTGNYFLGVDFGEKAVELQAVTAGTLDRDDVEDTGTLTVARQQMMHFVLDARAEDGSAAASVRLTIEDGQGRVVGSAVARSGGDAVSLTLTLAPGTYTVRLTAFTADGSLLPRVRYRLFGSRLSDPIGPQAEDSTEQMNGAPPPSSGSSPPPSSSSQPPPSSTTSPPPSDTSSTTTSSGSSSPPPGSTASGNDEWYYWSGEDPYSDPYAAG